MELLVADLCLPGDPWQRAETRHPSSLQAASSVRRKGKRASMMSAFAKATRHALSPGCLHRCLERPARRWRVLACGLFGDKDVRLMKRLAGRVVALACAGTGMEIRNAQNAVQVRYHCFAAGAYGVSILNLQPEAESEEFVRSSEVWHQVSCLWLFRASWCGRQCYNSR